MILFAWHIVPASPAAETGEATNSLARALLPLIEAHRGEVGLAVENLKSGESYECQADRPMPTASLIKLPAMRHESDGRTPESGLMASEPAL